MTSAAEWLSDPAKNIAKTPRPAQVRMASLVENTLSEKGFAMIEAGTGTGKSFAYLLPAILSGKRVLVSTAKKALQKQLRDNDMPFLLNALGIETTFASLKGKNNYVCKLRLDDFVKGDMVHRFSAREIQEFQRWAVLNDIGELDDYEQELDFASFVRVSECVVRQCGFADACGYRRAKTAAGMAKIVIVNHALLAFDLALGGGKIVGSYDAVIVDEAHQAAKYFREAHTCRIHNKQPEALRKLMQDTALRVPETLESRVHAFLAKLPERGKVPKSNDIVEASLAVYRDLSQIKQQLIADGSWSEKAEDVDPDEPETLRDARELGRLRAAATVTKRMMQACEVCVDKLDLKIDEHGAEKLTPEDFVMFVETRTARGDVHKEFVATPVEVGPFVAPVLKKTETVVFTSATLSTGGNFDYACREFGLKPDDVAVKEALPPTFNYKLNSCLYVSPTTIEYRRDDRYAYWDNCAREMHELLSASQGGAFILCSSYEDMTAFFERLNSMRGRNYQLRSQSGNVDGLISWFKEERSPVVLGVKSIWEGVDIPGLGLRLVIIPRLPFPNPDDPVFTARKSKYVAARVRRGAEPRVAELNAWQAFDLQEALMDLKQGAGRLIRRETDRGVVAVLDKRAYPGVKRYGDTVRNALPHPVTYDLNAAKRFLSILASQV
jgi:ATP-dependent DNA helicase DinG